MSIKDKFQTKLQNLRESVEDQLDEVLDTPAKKKEYQDKAEKSFKASFGKKNAKDGHTVSKRLEGLRMSLRKKLKESEQLDELSRDTARRAEDKAAAKYYNDYDDETRARRKAIKDKTPESRAEAEKAKEKREKSAKRTMRFQAYANKKKLDEAPSYLSKKHGGTWEGPSYLSKKHGGTWEGPSYLSKKHGGTWDQEKKKKSDKKLDEAVTRRKLSKHEAQAEVARKKAYELGSDHADYNKYTAMMHDHMAQHFAAMPDGKKRHDEHKAAAEHYRNRMKKIDEQQLDELKDATHMSYRAKARNQIDKMVNNLGNKMMSGTVNTKKLKNRADGIKKSYKLQPGLKKKNK